MFCRIARGEVDSDTLYSSGEVVAFRDVNPVAPTHVLVIPKRHIGSAKELSGDDGDLLTQIFRVLNEIAAREGLDGGYRVVTNVGPDAGQSVDHLHFHLMGGRTFSWPPG